MPNNNPLADDAARTVNDGRSTAAEGLESAASTIRDKAESLPGGDKVRTAARAVADRLSTSANYVRTHDARRMMADVETVVKNNPGPALLIAAGLGFIIGRALSRD